MLRNQPQLTPQSNIPTDLLAPPPRSAEFGEFPKPSLNVALTDRRWAARPSSRRCVTRGATPPSCRRPRRRPGAAADRR